MTKVFNILIGLSLGCLCGPAVLAQDGSIPTKGDTTRIWGLRDVVEYALDNNVQLQAGAIEVENKDIALKTTQFSRLPNLYGSIGEDMNFGRSQNREGVTEDQSSYNTSISAGTSIPVFEGFKINRQAKADKFSLEAARLELEQSRQDLSLQIVGYYLQVIYNREALRIACDQVEINRKLVDNTRKMVDGGTKTTSELYNAMSSLATSESNLVTARNSCTTSMLDLVQAINYPDYHGFELETPTADEMLLEAMFQLTPADSIYEDYLSRRPGILAAESKVKMAEHNVKVAKSAYWPSIQLGVSYGTGYYATPQSSVERGSFFTQLGYNGQVVIGATMYIPIFNRMATVNSVRTARNSVRTQELSLRQNRLDAIKEVQTAFVNASTALGKYEAGLKSEDAARKAFEFEQKKYESGRSTAYQFDEMRQKHAQAELELVQAKYNFIFRVKILDFYKGNPLY